MIYTTGHSVSYRQYFKEQEIPQKLGKINEYPGGSVWQTAEEAQQHCLNGYEVFGVLADWNKDTQPSQDGDWHDLIKTSDLVLLEMT